MNYFYTDQTGAVVGPISREALQKLADAGMTAPDCQACYEGSEDWQPLAAFVRPTAKAKANPLPTHPPPDHSTATAPPAKDKTTAKKVPGTRLAGGREAHLELVAIIFAVLGAIGGVGFFISAEDAPRDFRPYLIGLGLASMFNGIAVCIVLFAGAEIIRLLKKLCSLPFDGTISAPREEQANRISNLCLTQKPNDRNA